MIREKEQKDSQNYESQCSTWQESTGACREVLAHILRCGRASVCLQNCDFRFEQFPLMMSFDAAGKVNVPTWLGMGMREGERNGDEGGKNDDE